MKLRTTVRLPQRLDQDAFYLPLSQIPPRKKKSNVRPRYVDYNPNLPPAAFPTLDTPRADVPENAQIKALSCNHLAQKGGSDSEDLQAGVKRPRARKSLDEVRSLAKPRGQGYSKTDELENMPMDLVENYIASNTELNPVYVSNMAKMAAAGQGSWLLNEMGDSDLDEDMASTSGASAADVQTPTWADLSHQMQAEIFTNLLDRHSWSKVCYMMGLTTQEQRMIQDLLRRRSEQIELEDIKLNAMRAKQLRDLLRVDNSSRNHTSSQQLLFCKASRHAFRVLKEATETDLDFLSCERSELTAARKFLRKRGIDSKFAGNWRNDIALVQAPEEEPVPKTASLHDGPLPSPVLPPQKTAPSTNLPSPEPTVPTAVKGAFVNWLGDTATGARVCYPPSTDEEPKAAARLLTLVLQDRIEHKGLLRVKRRMEALTKSPSAPGSSFYLQTPPQTPPLKPHHDAPQSPPQSPPQNIPPSNPQILPPGCYIREDLNGDTTEETSTEPGPSLTPSTETINGMGQDPKPPTEVPPSFFSEAMSEILAGSVEQYVPPPELRRAPPMEEGMGGQETDLAGLVKTAVFINLLPPLTPPRARSPIDSNQELSGLSLIRSPETAVRNAEFRPSPNVYLGEGESNEPDGSARSLKLSESVQMAQEVDYGRHAGEEDEPEHEDEMILLPRNSRV
ncbi:uncharacterized protein BJX67DRAFT_376649 [Aspergillus lucknowensis]|uniref:Uncharacterized protein n=1 Tax=Aspergillus lucknowensis TaxID=176173 RepID=A0ABR4M5A1_9EURO